MATSLHLVQWTPTLRYTLSLLHKYTIHVHTLYMYSMLGLCKHKCIDSFYLQLWDVRRKGCIFTYKGHTEAINSIQFSPDGKWVVSASSDSTIKVTFLVQLLTNNLHMWIHTVNNAQYTTNMYSVVPTWYIYVVPCTFSSSQLTCTSFCSQNWMMSMSALVQFGCYHWCSSTCPWLLSSVL